MKGWKEIGVTRPGRSHQPDSMSRPVCHGSFSLTVAGSFHQLSLNSAVSAHHSHIPQSLSQELPAHLTTGSQERVSLALSLSQLFSNRPADWAALGRLAQLPLSPVQVSESRWTLVFRADQSPCHLGQVSVFLWEGWRWAWASLVTTTLGTSHSLNLTLNQREEQGPSLY